MAEKIAQSLDLADVAEAGIACGGSPNHIDTTPIRNDVNTAALAAATPSVDMREAIEQIPHLGLRECIRILNEDYTKVGYPSPVSTEQIQKMNKLIDSLRDIQPNAVDSINAVLEKVFGAELRRTPGHANAGAFAELFELPSIDDDSTPDKKKTGGKAVFYVIEAVPAHGHVLPRKTKFQGSAEYTVNLKGTLLQRGQVFPEGWIRLSPDGGNDEVQTGPSYGIYFTPYRSVRPIQDFAVTMETQTLIRCRTD